MRPGPGHRPARRVVQSAACRPSHDQRGGTQARGARQGLVDRFAGQPAQEAVRDGAVGRAAGAVPRVLRKTPTSLSPTSRPTCRRPTRASTLAFLKTRSPLVRFVWIMGADNLATFDRWQRWREIFTMVPVVVVDRPGWRMKALASKAARAFAAARVPEADAGGLALRPAPAWTFLTGPLSHVSSTALRNNARRRWRGRCQKVTGDRGATLEKAAAEAEPAGRAEAAWRPRFGQGS